MMKQMSKAESYNSAIMDEILSSVTPEEEEKVRKRMLLAARIDRAIKAKGWKKKDLAQALNKQRSEITKWLSGTHSFTTDTLFDIERVLNVVLVTLSDKPIEQVVKYQVLVVSQPAEVEPCTTVGAMSMFSHRAGISRGKRSYTVSSNN